MTLLLRPIVFILIVWLLVAGFFVTAGILTFIYLLFYSGYEILILAILADGYYQHFDTMPIFSLIAILAIIFLEFLKPLLLMYTE